MDREESFALLRQGRDIWNAWAKKILAERDALEASGTWTAGRDEFDWNDATQAWHAAAAVDLSGGNIKGSVDFSGFVFPGAARFDGATFPSQVHFSGTTFPADARFDGAKFSGGARFDGAAFSGGARFDGATFPAEALFTGATFSGSARFDDAKFVGAAQFSGATFEGAAFFSQARFTRAASFGQARFEVAVQFDGAMFSGGAEFSQARFARAVQFDKATFAGAAQFDGTTFAHYSRFDGATFASAAVFVGAVFARDAVFLETVFEGFTEFDGARFEGAVDFRAMEGKSGFSLAGVTFLAVPNFMQAHFSEAPRFDDCRIRPRGFWPSILAEVRETFVGDPNLTGPWRALKRLAIQGHDHEREQEFFTGELKSRRGNLDKLLSIKFLFGLLYQLLSNFGRSLLLPLLWWTASVGVFAGLYLREHLARAAHPGFCVVGPGDPWMAALGLSLRKGLLFLGLDSTDKLNQLYGCLYGIYPAKPWVTQFPETFSPVVPDGVAFLGLAQLLFSAVLIFLFLLALRNHFRIK